MNMEYIRFLQQKEELFDSCYYADNYSLQHDNNRLYQ